MSCDDDHLWWFFFSSTKPQEDAYYFSGMNGRGNKEFIIRNLRARLYSFAAQQGDSSQVETLRTLLPPERPAFLSYEFNSIIHLLRD